MEGSFYCKKSEVNALPERPLRPCKHPGCHALTRSGWCDQHYRPRSPAWGAKRPSPSARGYTYRWYKASKSYLASHPWCAECERNSRATLATEVDHIVPHKGNQALFWDRANWQPLCHSCHSRKTAKENAFSARAPLPPEV